MNVHSITRATSSCRYGTELDSTVWPAIVSELFMRKWVWETCSLTLYRSEVLREVSRPTHVPRHEGISCPAHPPLMMTAAWIGVDGSERAY